MLHSLQFSYVISVTYYSLLCHVTRYITRYCKSNVICNALPPTLSVCYITHCLRLFHCLPVCYITHRPNIA